MKCPGFLPFFLIFFILFSHQILLSDTHYCADTTNGGGITFILFLTPEARDPIFIAVFSRYWLGRDREGHSRNRQNKQRPRRVDSVLRIFPAFHLPKANQLR